MARWDSVALFLTLTLVTAGANAAVLPMPAHNEDAQFEQPKSPDELALEKKLAKARKEQRFKQLKVDADKLLKLATELKQYVDKANDSILSLEVIQKADEIEKLSKSVKNKMRGE
ncbi:MAG TPA: hypothetical protein VN622_00815 [Clostridia bacterium]|nr:hypothetical protein [Clostridia bacterium]